MTRKKENSGAGVNGRTWELLGRVVESRPGGDLESGNVVCFFQRGNKIAIFQAHPLLSNYLALFMGIVSY